MSLHKHPKSCLNDFFSTSLRSSLRTSSQDELKVDFVNRDGITFSQTVLDNDYEPHDNTKKVNPSQILKPLASNHHSEIRLRDVILNSTA